MNADSIYEPAEHHRRSVRFPGYDYSFPGAYFITICAHRHKNIFGRCADKKMYLNAFGEIASIEWNKTEIIRKEIRLDSYMIMQNHLHAVVWITNLNLETFIVGANGYSPSCITNKIISDNRAYRHTPLRSPSNTIGSLIRGFKSSTTNKIHKINKKYNEPVWQRNYYEHIIRNENELNFIREYIRTNPANWRLDKYYF